jgi:hypothetical protein
METPLWGIRNAMRMDAGLRRDVVLWCFGKMSADNNAPFTRTTRIDTDFKNKKRTG